MRLLQALVTAVLVSSTVSRKSYFVSYKIIFNVQYLVHISWYLIATLNPLLYQYKNMTHRVTALLVFSLRHGLRSSILFYRTTLVLLFGKMMSIDSIPIITQSALLKLRFGQYMMEGSERKSSSLSAVSYTHLRHSILLHLVAL